MSSNAYDFSNNMYTYYPGLSSAPPTQQWIYNRFAPPVDGQLMTNPTNPDLHRLYSLQFTFEDYVSLPLHTGFGTCSSAVAPGASCNISCDVGYQVDGPSYSCSDAGTIFGGPQSCIPAPCMVPVASILHGTQGACGSLIPRHKLLNQRIRCGRPNLRTFRRKCDWRSPSMSAMS